MIVEHALPKPFCRRGQPLRVLIVGAGGNGSAMLLGLPYLHQAMKVWGHTGGIHIMLADAVGFRDQIAVRQHHVDASGMTPHFHGLVEIGQAEQHRASVASRADNQHAERLPAVAE